jgi:hypothetical protein
MKVLYAEPELIPERLLDAFQEAKNLREDADYYSRWSEPGCQKLLKLAEEFLAKAEELIGRS